MGRLGVPVAVLGAGAALLALVLLTLATGAEPDPGYATRRVCVNATSTQSLFLDGGETVGDSFDADDFGLTGALTSTEIAPSDGNEYFFTLTLTTGAVQLKVSDAGASSLGLDDDQVYPVSVKADNGNHTADLNVGVWLDAETLSPNNDGRC